MMVSNFPAISAILLALCVYTLIVIYWFDLSVSDLAFYSMLPTCDHKGRPKKIMWYGVGGAFRERVRNDYFVGCKCENCVYDIPVFKNEEFLEKEMFGPFDADAVLIQGSHMKSLAVAPIRKDRNQVFVFVDREPVMLADQYMEQQWNQRHFIDIFNWTFTYRHDSDILYPYGEIVPKPKSSKNTKISSQSMKSIGVKEGVELNKNLKKKTNLMKKPKIGVKSAVNRKKIRVSSDVSKKIEVFNKVMEMNNVHANGAGDKLQSNDISKSTQNIYDDIYNAKTRNVAWVVSHCATSSNRLAFVHEMQEYIDIDIYGRCGNLTIQYKEMGSIFMNKLEKKYRFYLAFENSYETDYATEKLFDWFEKDLIVVVRGAANYSKIVPTNTVVNAADFDTAESLAQYLRILGSEKSRYVGYLRRKSLYKVKTRKEIWKRANCQLCYMLHNVDIYRKSYSHIGKWWKHYD